LIFLGFKIGQRWLEAVMDSWGSYFVPVPNIDLVTEADKKEILAINGKIHDEMLNLLELK